MKYEIIILEPAKIFLESLELKLRAKSYRTIELLEEFGLFLKEPHAKKVSDSDSLFELRVKQGNNICRFFYFHDKNSIYIITSGYLKKTQKLNKNEIEKAEKLFREFKDSKNGQN